MTIVLSSYAKPTVRVEAWVYVTLCTHTTSTVGDISKCEPPQPNGQTDNFPPNYFSFVPLESYRLHAGKWERRLNHVFIFN